MKYVDKNGSEWSPARGDWLGSFEKKSGNRFVVKFSIFLLLMVIIAVILLNLK